MKPFKKSKKRDYSLSSENAVDYYGFRRYFFASRIKNAIKFEKKFKNFPEFFEKEIRFSIPWKYKSNLYYIVLHKRRNGLFVMDSNFEKIWSFLEIFKGDEKYYDSYWKGVYDGVLFFTPVDPKIKICLYYIGMDELIEYALGRLERKKKRGGKGGGILGQFAF